MADLRKDNEPGRTSKPSNKKVAANRTGTYRRKSGRAKPEPQGEMLPEHFFNRELSWLQFNRRVLAEAENPRNPLLERLKFLAIFESNLDEFYMVRVSGLIEQETSGMAELSPDGLTPKEQLKLISEVAGAMRQAAGRVWSDTLRPLLAESGIVVHDFHELTPRRKEELGEFFRREVFDLCTPLKLDPAPTIPFISNRSLNLAVELRDDTGQTLLARVKVPAVLPRLIRFGKRRTEFALLEDVIEHNLADLFPGVEIVGAYRFRVIRDADIEIRQLEAEDLIGKIEETIHMRRFGAPVLLEVDSRMPAYCRSFLQKMLELDDDDVFTVEGLMGLEVFWEMARIERPSMRYPPHSPYVCEPLAQSATLFPTIAKAPVLLHHPFDSFRTVEEFVRSAAHDPAVIGIKQTLYRVGSESPIVEALLDAAQAGKQVAVMVELKARFDEENNLVWARALERAGVHVTYGFDELKTHCKLCLIVRRERGSIWRYAHIGTGNYNPSTARLYTDLGLLTDDAEITQDISELFNFLTGYAKQSDYRKILVAPGNLRQGILDRIQREIDTHRTKGGGRLFFKANSLVDPEMVQALYAASQAGVKVDLIIRGICCLRPGVPGLSENIRVLSIVGRFLEHSRIYYFANGGRPEAWIGSADLMRRNLDRRVEVLTPVEHPAHIHHLLHGILEVYWRDNTNGWDLQPDGQYRRRTAPPGQEFDSQRYLMTHSATRDALPREAAPRTETGHRPTRK